MPATPDSLRSALAGIHKQSSAVQRHGRAIGVSARDRLGDLDRRLAELRPSTLTDEASAREYSDLIEERGRLAHVLGLSNA